MVAGGGDQGFRQDLIICQDGSIHYEPLNRPVFLVVDTTPGDRKTGAVSLIAVLKAEDIASVVIPGIRPGMAQDAGQGAAGERRQSVGIGHKDAVITTGRPERRR